MLANNEEPIYTKSFIVIGKNNNADKGINYSLKLNNIVEDEHHQL